MSSPFDKTANPFADLFSAAMMASIMKGMGKPDSENQKEGDTEKKELLKDAKEAAEAIKALEVAFVEAGFTKEQAFELTKAALQSALN